MKRLNEMREDAEPLLGRPLTRWDRFDACRTAMGDIEEICAGDIEAMVWVGRAIVGCAGKWASETDDEEIFLARLKETMRWMIEFVAAMEDRSPASAVAPLIGEIELTRMDAEVSLDLNALHITAEDDAR